MDVVLSLGGGISPFRKLSEALPAWSSAHSNHFFFERRFLFCGELSELRWAWSSAQDQIVAIFQLFFEWSFSSRKKLAEAMSVWSLAKQAWHCRAAAGNSPQERIEPRFLRDEKRNGLIHSKGGGVDKPR
ncbi:MAG: hypothetical protein A2945_02265 [Candidatus Liptonbacteria bacterium RIFCSPLOWO2_01_FULL_52_25]|uniref:Uncharacterized protein n=1 Tax=Candidatus Liptonbacteria bacterium RIFCSPLOWO2_01_FULL_52_25 TaxID=1798650 RepID=A0A1G2CEH4_9BACT|nr:MAG: hypothetical protein A2945_02265 [Candidatus Liptonbacteria bacterium RIFCSPLOWO2_01_FULL_52_25]